MSTEPLYQLVYVSRCSVPMTDDQLHAIQTQAVKNNEAMGVSGILMYRQGCFLQLLEGAKPALASLYGRIALDERHTHSSLLYFAQAEQRSAGTWSMGVLNLDSISGSLSIDDLLYRLDAQRRSDGIEDPVRSLVMAFQRLNSNAA